MAKYNIGDIVEWRPDLPELVFTSEILSICHNDTYLVELFDGWMLTQYILDEYTTAGESIDPTHINKRAWVIDERDIIGLALCKINIEEDRGGLQYL